MEVQITWSRTLRVWWACFWRNLVVLVAANAYLQMLAADARTQSARAQLQTSQTLYQQAQDLKQSGIIATVYEANTRLGGRC